MTFLSLTDNIINVIEYVIILVLALALLYFIYGVLSYITQFGDEEKRKESVQVMTNGIIALTAMFVIWSLVALVTDLVGSSVGIPQF